MQNQASTTTNFQGNTEMSLPGSNEVYWGDKVVEQVFFRRHGPPQDPKTLTGYKKVLLPYSFHRK